MLHVYHCSFKAIYSAFFFNSDIKLEIVQNNSKVIGYTQFLFLFFLMFLIDNKNCNAFKTHTISSRYVFLKIIRLLLKNYKWFSISMRKSNSLPFSGINNVIAMYIAFVSKRRHTIMTT